MIFLMMLGLALVLMLPLVVMFIAPRRTQGRREAALALHKAQLVELARDLADGRIGEAEYAAAKLEVERRLLTADTSVEPAWNGNAKLLLIATVVAIPVAAFALYLPGSTPFVPSEPHAQWLAKEQAGQAKLAVFVNELRARLATEDPNSADASQGEAYLGEALAEQAGEITPEALGYFKQSLANAPQDASWRPLDVQRIGEAAQAASQ
jgi:cytochrome c-type biogenesis protein CcmH